MQCSVRLTALAVASLASVHASDAALVVSAASRETSVLSGGAVVDTYINSLATGSFNGDANDVGADYSSIATQGSNLLSSRMTFVGGCTVIQSSAGARSARSLATVTFQATLGEAIRWSVNLNSLEFGESNVGAVSARLVDTVTGTVVFNYTRTFVAQGTATLLAGRNYRLEISSTATTLPAGDAESTYNVGVFVIPAPGAMALLGLAGIAGRRRR